MNYNKKINLWLRQKSDLWSEKLGFKFGEKEKIILKEEKIIPLNSQVLLGCKILPIELEKIILTIFYIDVKYPPIIIETTFSEAEKFILSDSPMHYYLFQSGWSYGWGLIKGKKLGILNVFSPKIKKAILDIDKTWKKIQLVTEKLPKKFSEFKNNPNFFLNSYFKKIKIDFGKTFPKNYGGFLLNNKINNKNYNWFKTTEKFFQKNIRKKFNNSVRKKRKEW